MLLFGAEAILLPAYRSKSCQLHDLFRLIPVGKVPEHISSDDKKEFRIPVFRPQLPKRIYGVADSSSFQLNIGSDEPLFTPQGFP